MKLPVGARLPHDFADIPTNDPEVVQRNRALYRITHVLSETPWSCLYRGKKVFRNFEFSKGTLSEAAEDECLDVLIRTLSYPRTDDRDYIRARREHSRFEAQQVLGSRHTNLMAEPLDYLEVRNDQDRFAFAGPGNIPTTEPVLVFETIHGDNLARWRQTARVDAARGMHVLGQMLEFLNKLHEAKFLLNVVAPASFWIDDLHRVHVLGTENVVDESRAATWRSLFPNERYPQGFVAPELLQPGVAPSRQSDLYGWATLVWFLLTGDSPAKLATDQQQQRWARFEPVHRERLRSELARLTPQQVAGVRRELNVAGSRFDSLWPDAFLDGLWSCLNIDVAQRPGSVSDLRAWWGNPPPPPVPVCLVVRKHPAAARIAFSTRGLRGGTLFQVSRRFGQPSLSSKEGDVAWRGSTAGPIEVVVPMPPGTSRGQAVSGEWCFSIFAVETQGEITSVSRATEARLLDGTAPGFRKHFAESLAGGAGSIPEEVALLAVLDPIEVVAAELLDSSEPRVRGWAVSLLERGLVGQVFYLPVTSAPVSALAPGSPSAPASELGLAGKIPAPRSATPTSVACRRQLEDRALVDDENSVRQQAAGALIRAASHVDVLLVVGLAQKMGGSAVDEMIRAARGFVALGVSMSVVDQAIEALEQAHRIVVCEVCQQELRARELDSHLTTEHHYVPLDGTLLPFGQALIRLWSRVLQRCDADALSMLTGHLQQRHPQSVVSAFAAALSQQVLLALQTQRTLLSEEQRRTWSHDLALCLRSDQVARSACWSLLGHDDSRIRELVREVVLIAVASRLADDHVTAAMFRRVVDEFAPVPILSERIDACRRLVESGADPLAGEHCEQQLDLERLVDCPECGTTFPKRDLPQHRRHEHQVFEWDGRRYDWDRLVALLLGRTVSAEPDAFAARSLTELFIERHGTTAWQPLFTGLRDKLLKTALRNGSDKSASVVRTPWSGRGEAQEQGHQSRTSEPPQTSETPRSDHQTARPDQGVRTTTLVNEYSEALASGLGAAVGSLPLASRLTRAFLDEEDAVCQSAALAIFANHDAEPPADLSRRVAACVRQPELPFAICQQAVVSLLRQPSIAADISRTALLALADRADDKLQGVELLHDLEQWVGASPAIEAACAELLSKIRMRCPRCETTGTPTELAEHVRVEHGLILEGRSVRQPWSVAIDCLDEYAENPKSHLLERAEQMSTLASPDSGRKRLLREALRRGIAPNHYRRELIEANQPTSLSLCPECWEGIPTGEAPLNEVQLDARGNIQSETVTLKHVGLHGLWGSVEIEPWNGAAPRWVVSRWGAVAIVGLLFLVPSAVFGLMMWQGIAVAQSAALGGLLGGLIGMAVVALFYWPRATEPVDAAWELVVPALLDDPERPFGPAHSAFLASLARVSCGRGDTRHRQPMLKRAIQTVHHLVRQGALPARHLAELWHLRLDDAMQSERVHGPREAVVRELLSQLLHGDGSADHATHGGTVLMRLRRDELLALVWHLAAEARSVGLVPGDLVALAKKSSTIAALLTATSVSPKALACFFAILELEEAREVPPEICTTRSLLSQARHRLLEKHALLLARSRLPGLSPVSDRDAIWLTVEGLVFRGHTFTSLPDIRTIELTQYIQISGQYQTQVIGHQLTVGKQSWTCRSQPTALAAELRQLAVFRFQKLLLKAEAWSQRSPTSHLARILAEPLSRCPHCGAVLRLRKGMLAERTTTAVAD